MYTDKPIIFTDNSATILNEIILANNYKKIAVLVDENTLKHCYPFIKDVIPTHQLIEIKSGEVNKNLSTCSLIWQALTDGSFDRKSLFINLGGGVIGDMGGFCASTFKRGIDFINVPTTLLSQVDASVGGKLGIDFNGFKNHIGLFKNPKHVIIDTQYLNTLPENELRSGFAETIKHNLIADQAGWQTLIKTDFKNIDWQNVVNHSVAIKEEVVESDPFEAGKRKILNFGHTVGHAVESYLLNSNRPILHGEAVALGMICESFISNKKGHISLEDHEEIVKYINSIYPKVDISEADVEEILMYLIQDKKNKEGTILAALLGSVGRAIWDEEINHKEVTESLNYYMSN